MPETLRRLVPAPVKTAVKAVLLRMGRSLDHPAMIGRGTVQDLYYWVSDGRVDTTILLNNVYSVFFPHLQTATTGTVTVYDPQGVRLGEVGLPVGHLQCEKLVLSRLLRQWQPSGGPAPQFGTVLCALTIPPAVLEALASRLGPFYFWYRFYIEYVTAAGQPAFVHCVDRTTVVRHGRSKPALWYSRRQARDWAPEIPMNVEEYRRLFVILVNRTPQPVRMTLLVEDDQDRAERFPAMIPAGGVHRFELSRQILHRLAPRGLRMRVCDMPTTWARPVLFKEFANGTISAMHC